MLEEWTYAKIEEIVDKNLIESRLFDFKGNLPDSERLSVLACGFANTVGGFLILGVVEKGLYFMIKPIPFDKEIANKFGQKLKAEPPIDFDVVTVDVPRSSNKLVVFHIPESHSKPHRTMTEGKQIFWKRTNEGNVPMTFEEIKEAFQHNLKNETEQLRRLSNEVFINEASRRLRLKKYYIPRIVKYYDRFEKKYKDFKKFCFDSRSDPDQIQQRRFELVTQNLTNLLKSFVYVATEDFKTIFNIVDNPNLQDKFILMITTCANDFECTLSKIYLGSNYLANDFQDLDSTIEFIDARIQDLKDEIEE
jgi:hypothetical protein